MNLGISHLAWDNNDLFGDLSNILIKNNINFLEVVFPKLISWKESDYSKIDYFFSLVKSLGFNIYSTQSILHKSNVFDMCSIDFINHINIVCEICGNYNIKKIVLGAPSIRNVYAQDELLNVFFTIDNILKDKNQILCIEPNADFYMGKYFFTIKEIVSFIKLGNFTNIKTMIDTHNILLMGESPKKELLLHKDYIHHIHISEKNLGYFTNSQDHIDLSKQLKKIDYTDPIIYEVKDIIKNKESLQAFNKIYS